METEVKEPVDQQARSGVVPLEQGLKVVERIQAAFHLDSLIPQIAAVSRALPERQVVNVAVVGRFKAGKSSFLNGIIGREVLPVDVLPATSVITQVSHGASDRAVVRYLDGRVEEIDLERIAEFATEKKNPGNSKQVAVVDVELESLRTFSTIRFVDTPGLGSVFTEATRTSLEWLPDIGAAVVALTVDAPLSENDLRLLCNVLRFTPEILILLTKADQVSDENLPAVLTFVAHEVEKRLGREVPIYPYSTKPGYEQVRARVRDYLVERVVRQHEERLAEILGHKLRNLVKECQDYLALAAVAVDAGDKARAELLELAGQEQGNLAQVRREIQVLTRDLEQRAHAAAAEGYSRLFSRVLEAVRSDFDRESRTWRGHLGKTSEAFQRWADDTLHRKLAEVLPQGEQFIAPVLAEALDHFRRIVRAFQDRLGVAVETALGMHFSGATFQAEVEPPRFPDIRVERTFDIPLDMVWFLVPMPLFRRLVYWRLRSQLPWEVEKNLTRLAWQWTEAAHRSLESIAEQAESFMGREAATVVELAASTDDRAGRIKAALGELDRLSQALGQGEAA